jgi:hypothetical protein
MLQILAKFLQGCLRSNELSKCFHVHRKLARLRLGSIEIIASQPDLQLLFCLKFEMLLGGRLRSTRDLLRCY